MNIKNHNVVCFILFFVLLSLLLSSCNQDGIAVDSNRIKTVPYGADFLITSTVSDEYWHYYSDTLSNHRNEFQAVFSDGYQYVNIGSIQNQFISLNNGDMGHYNDTYFDVGVYPSDGEYDWNLISYLDSDITIKQTLVPRLTILSPHKRDTVSKKGFTLKYEGSSNAVRNEFSLIQLNSANEEMGIDISLDAELLPIRLSFVDNGSIKIKSTDLSSLIPNRYYQYNISHSKFDTVYHKGLTGILHSSASISQYVFITD